jgi:hypothetical protein
MDSLIIYTPSVSGARVLYYNDLSEYFNLTIVCDRAISKKLLNDYGVEKCFFDYIVLGGFEINNYMNLSPILPKLVPKFNKTNHIIIEQLFSPNGIMLSFMLRVTGTRYLSSIDGGIIKRTNLFYKILKRLLLKGTHTMFYTGKVANDYLDYYGKLVVVIN